MMAKRVHPNLRKCVRDYPKQEEHFRARVRQLLREDEAGAGIPFAFDRIPNEQQLRRISRWFGIDMTNLLGTSCQEAVCAKWHTNPDDR